MRVGERKGFTARESRVRQIAFRAGTALSVLLASLVFSLVVPIFPKELMILCAIGLGALAYKYPSLAVTLMFILALPGYFYQIDAVLPAANSLPFPLVVIISALLLCVGIVAAQAGATLGIAVGAGAAILMLTPLQFLALPIIIGTILFRTKGKLILCACSIFTFTVLYFPLLSINSGQAAGAIPPLFEPIVLHFKPPVSILSLNEVSAALGQIIEAADSNGIQTYLTTLGNYWPLSLGERLLPLGILFCLLVGGGMLTGNGILTLSRWLKKRDVNYSSLRYVTPALSLLAGVLVFYLLANVFARPFDYANTVRIIPLLIGTLLMGGSASAVEVWLKKRDHILYLRDELLKQTREIQDQTDFLMNRTREMKSQCCRMDVSSEEALSQMCEQELKFAEQTLTEMSSVDLEQKALRFQELQTDLNQSINETNSKLYQYYDEDRQKFNDRLLLAQKYGFDLGEIVQGPEFSQLTSMEFDEVLAFQETLNKSYEQSTSRLAEEAQNLEEKLSRDVDPSLRRTGIRIAADYLAQARFADAMHEYLVELGDIEHVLQEMLAGLDKEVLNVLINLNTIMVDVLMPTATNLGDVNSAKYYQGVMDKIAALSRPPNEIRPLPSIILIVTKAVELSEVIAALSARLGDKMAEMEKILQSKTPRGYNWGIDPQIYNRTIDISRAFSRTSSPMKIQERVSLLKTGPPAIDSAARAIKDYSIAHELLVNYSNIESFIEETLQNSGEVICDDIPVKRQYSHRYLELFSVSHPRDVVIEADTGRLIKTVKTTTQLKSKILNQNKSYK
jgi:hypothetical protein